MRATPTVSRIYCDWLEAQDHSKAHAMDTPFRFSGAMGCARALSYDALGSETTDPMDGPSLAITAMGSLLHEDIQAAYALMHPNAKFETKATLGITSGHVDIDDEEADEVVEIKTVGATKFDMAVGLQRRQTFDKATGEKVKARETHGKGPGIDHICQAGFNARARGRKTVRIVYISREAVSVPKAEYLNWTGLQRFAAEWTFTEDEWGPIVDAELARLDYIKASVEEGMLPDRQDFDDGKSITPDPDKHWRCDYCSHAHQCRMDGPGVVPVEIRRAS